MTESDAAALIGPADRVLDVLARDERLVDVFVRHSPQFEKLRSPAVRRVMARLVTVEQAARMAGIAADALVRDLNVALFGADTAYAASAPARHAEASTVPPAATRPAALPVVELDVRDDLRLGREPFSRIMAAVSALGDGQGLHLRTIFEPVPLFAVLAKRGFSHESRQDASDDWSAWFWRATPAEVQIPRLAALARDDDGRASAVDEGREREVWLDVRGLEPPQPMLRTLAALEDLPEGHALIQINVRVPQLLLPVLAERGYACEVDDSPSGRVLVRIRRSRHH
jgi:uncharacterized protein (DUF2249 family)